VNDVNTVKEACDFCMTPKVKIVYVCSNISLMIKEYKPRPDYISRIRPFIGKDIIKVLVGHRRVGKSYMISGILLIGKI